MPGSLKEVAVLFKVHPLYDIAVQFLFLHRTRLRRRYLIFFFFCAVSVFLHAIIKLIQLALLQLIYWEDKHFYIEQQFISLTDNFIRAVVLSRQTVTGLKIPVDDVIAEIEPEVRKPEPTKELQLWLESMEESSQSLKKQK